MTDDPYTITEDEMPSMNHTRKCDKCGADTDPAPAERPEPSEALEALQRLTEKAQAAKPYVGGFGELQEARVICQALSQPAPAVPDDREQAIDLVARIIERHTEKPPGPSDPPYDYQPEWIKRMYRRKAEAAIAAAPTPTDGEKS